MRIGLFGAALCACVGMAPVPDLAAQTDDLIGVWSVRYARNTRTEADGTMTVLEWGDARLALARGSDGSLVGRWTRAGDTTVLVFSGSGASDGFTLSLDWDASGLKPTERTRSQHIQGRMEGERLTGTSWIIGSAVRSGVRMPWTAGRAGA